MQITRQQDIERREKLGKMPAVYPSPVALDAAEVAVGVLTGNSPVQFPENDDDAAASEFQRLVTAANKVLKGAVWVEGKPTEIELGLIASDESGGEPTMTLQPSITFQIGENPKTVAAVHVSITRSQYLAFVSLARSVLNFK